MLKKCEELIITDPDYSNGHNVEHHLWKSGFYIMVEMYRKMAVEENAEDSKRELLALLDEVRSSLFVSYCLQSILRRLCQRSLW